MEPILLKPTIKNLLWGSEQWGISAHQNGDNEVLNKEFEGVSLSELFKNHPELFGNISLAQFPLLTKIINANTDLSIQVHPDDEYAFKNENGSLGKTECWYIIDAKQDATIVIGHNAKNKEELQFMINNGKWNDFIREVPVHKGDFFFIEPGTVHAIKGGTKILETQQSSDITYRVYDYDRLQNGKPRQLHVKQSLDVIKSPFIQKEPPLNKDISIGDVTQLVSCNLFTVWHGVVKDKLLINQNRPFLLCSVIGGLCKIGSHSFEKGNHFILPYNYGSAEFNGEAELIFSSI